MEKRKIRTIVTLALAGVDVVAGAVVMFAGFAASTTSFGWFAYAPLSDSVYIPSSGMPFQTWTLFGGALFVAGLVVISYLIGRRSGAKRRQQDSLPPR